LKYNALDFSSFEKEEYPDDPSGGGGWFLGSPKKQNEYHNCYGYDIFFVVRLKAEYFHLNRSIIFILLPRIIKVILYAIID